MSSIVPSIASRPSGSTVRYGRPATGGATKAVAWRKRRVHAESVIAVQTWSGLAAMKIW